MMTTFLATVAFAIGLLAFCAGAWMTMWANSNQCRDTLAAKLTGYFVTIFSLLALVFSAYYVARGIFLQDHYEYNWGAMPMQQQGHMMHHKGGTPS